MDFEYLLFDLDGTLTDPAEGITNSFIHAYKYFGMEIPSYEKLCSFIGPPLVWTFENEWGFTGEKVQEGVKAYREYFAVKGLFENRVYDGIEELLIKLKAAGKKLVVATSKPENFSVQIMDHFGLTKYFEAVCGSLQDETRTKKAEVIAYALETCGIKDKSRVLMIGDRLHDVAGAKENGIKCCGILYGYGNRKEHEEAGADYIIESVEELEKFLLS